MTDIHCHILPQVDDGSDSLRMSLEMADLAARSGVQAVVATPHCMDEGLQDIQSAWALLHEALEEVSIPLKLMLGMEIFGTHRTAELLRSGKLLTLNGSRYPLIEFSFHSDGEEETEILRSVLDAGYRPIVAHPERYSYIQRDPDLVNRWADMGCLLQLNRGSLLGRFGSAARNTAFALLSRGFAAAVASDAHSHLQRTPWMRDIWELLAEELSPEAAEALLIRNPQILLNNEVFRPAEPEWF